MTQHQQGLFTAASDPIRYGPEGPPQPQEGPGSGGRGGSGGGDGGAVVEEIFENSWHTSLGFNIATW